MNLFKALAHRVLLWGLRAPRLTHSVMPEGLALPGQHIRPVWIEGEGGSRLFAWYIAPPGPQEALAPGAVLMHGWGAHAGLMLPAAPWLHEAGLALLVLDARGHGLSSAVDFQSLPRFAQDVEAGLAWLRQQPEVDASRLALIGHSVGAGAVLLSATRQPTVRACGHQPERVCAPGRSHAALAGPDAHSVSMAWTLDPLPRAGSDRRPF